MKCKCCIEFDKLAQEQIRFKGKLGPQQRGDKFVGTEARADKQKWVNHCETDVHKFCETRYNIVHNIDIEVMNIRKIFFINS